MEATTRNRVGTVADEVKRQQFMCAVLNGLATYAISPDQVADRAYQIVDAMMEREAKRLEGRP